MTDFPKNALCLGIVPLNIFSSPDFFLRAQYFLNGLNKFYLQALTCELIAEIYFLV